MKTKALIVDDKMNDRLFLAKTLVAAFPDIEVEFAGSLDEAWFLLEKSKIDLILLDIEVDGGNGWEMLSELREKQSAISVIIVSAFSSVDFLKKAMRLDVLDYLDKPINSDELEYAVTKFLYKKAIPKEQLNGFYEEKLCLSTNKGTLYIEPSKIIYFETSKRDSMLYTACGIQDLLVKDSLVKLEKKLPNHSFRRVSRQFIVNVNYIKFVRRDKTLLLETPQGDVKLEKIYPKIIDEFAL